MITRSRNLTYADLQRLRETRDERLELIDGAIVVTPSPSPMHQRVSRRLHRLQETIVIDAHLGEFFAAPLDVRLDDGTVLQPDLMVLLKDRSRFVTESNVDGPPSLVFEIISPSTRHTDHHTKRALYARYGVMEYWLIDPALENVVIFTEPQTGLYRSQVTATTIADSATIPGLSVDLKPLFNRGPDD
jgi:Uma2 family endonuclease